MKKIAISLAVLAAVVTTTLSAQAQTTTSENNAANSAQSKSGNVKAEDAESGKSRAGVSRVVTGSRPKENSTSDKFDSSNQTSRENRASSDADGKVSVQKGRVKADPKTKQKRSNGRTFGNTNPDN
ncbi:hypothetical protein GCM10027299_38290 [Larkinella ripae]